MVEANSGLDTRTFKCGKKPNDPYNQLGYGFESYFKVLFNYSCIFLLFSVMMIPVFNRYSQYDGLVMIKGTDDAGRYWTKYSLGNMGFSGTKCITQYAGVFDATTKDF
jgi:hypothetical protein